jgi:hypothetical protein
MGKGAWQRSLCAWERRMINPVDPLIAQPSPEMRLKALERDGLTIEVDALATGTRTICVPALGGEFWSVGEQYQIDLTKLRVTGGRLIVARGRPLGDAAALRSRNIAVETVHIST